MFVLFTCKNSCFDFLSFDSFRLMNDEQINKIYYCQKLLNMLQMEWRKRAAIFLLNKWNCWAQTWVFFSFFSKLLLLFLGSYLEGVLSESYHMNLKKTFIPVHTSQSSQPTSPSLFLRASIPRSPPSLESLLSNGYGFIIRYNLFYL